MQVSPLFIGGPGISSFVFKQFRTTWPEALLHRNSLTPRPRPCFSPSYACCFKARLPSPLNPQALAASFRKSRPTLAPCSCTCSPKLTQEATYVCTSLRSLAFREARNSPVTLPQGPKPCLPSKPTSWTYQHPPSWPTPLTQPTLRPLRKKSNEIAQCLLEMLQHQHQLCRLRRSIAQLHPPMV